MMVTPAFTANTALNDLTGQSSRQLQHEAMTRQATLSLDPAPVNTARSALYDLVARLQHHQDEETKDRAGHDHTGDAGWVQAAADEKARTETYNRIIAETTVAIGHRIPSKTLAAFDKMINEGQLPSAGLLLSLDGFSNLDQQVYDAYMHALQVERHERSELKTMANGDQQWQNRTDVPDGQDYRPMEMKRRFKGDRID